LIVWGASERDPPRRKNEKQKESDEHSEKQSESDEHSEIRRGGRVRAESDAAERKRADVLSEKESGRCTN